MKIFVTNIVENLMRQYNRAILISLLKDKTTEKNIIWASDEYYNLGEEYNPEHEIIIDSITSFHSGVIKPRITKSVEAQQDRTRKKAEVMTPAWICNKMNNAADADWFGMPNVFNFEYETTWEINHKKVIFPEGKDWKQYVDDRRLEITCGEAPFITSRYDTTTGEIITPENRIGFLDRKLRIVNENAHSLDEWLKWAYRAIESTYGYEYQGDNLLIARINVFQTFSEYMEARWKRFPDTNEAKKAANIISWNLWQMDGLRGTIPIGKPQEEYHQMDIFDLIGNPDQCIIMRHYFSLYSILTIASETFVQT